MKTFKEFAAINEKVSSIAEFVTSLESTFKKHFPKSWIEVRSGKEGKLQGIGDVSIRFTLGDKSDWANGIVQNDPFLLSYMYLVCPPVILFQLKRKQWKLVQEKEFLLTHQQHRALE